MSASIYYMTLVCYGSLGHWETCRAGTLTAAKREASLRFADGWKNGLIKISEGDGRFEQRRIIAQRWNVAGHRWQKVES